MRSLASWLACMLCVASGCTPGTMMRVDALLVARGLFGSRAAAKAAVARGVVATKSGKTVKKASATIAADARLVILESSEDAGMHADAPSEIAAELAPQAQMSSEASSSSSCELTEAGLAVLLNAENVETASRRPTSAARAAARRNKRNAGKLSHAREMHGVDLTNANGLQGRGKASASSGEARSHKHYSKKNKRGTAV